MSTGGYAGSPEEHKCMVTRYYESQDQFHVRVIDDRDLPNGSREVVLDGAREKLQERPARAGWVDHKGVPHGGDIVAVTYWPYKDGSVGKSWEWAN